MENSVEKGEFNQDKEEEYGQEMAGDCRSRSRIRRHLSSRLRLAKEFLEDWIWCAVLGISVALCSVAMDYWIEHLQTWHVKIFEMAWIYSATTAYISWTGYILILVLASALFVDKVAPQAIGSGIPEVKTMMRGVNLKEYTSLRCLVSKMVGLTVSLGSGLPIGKEGPFVHVAVCIARLISRLNDGIQSDPFSNEKSPYSDLLAAACAVGVACTFSAPVGGVLFSIEITSMYFAVRNYWRGFFAAASSAILFRLFRYILKNTDTTVVAFYQTYFPSESFYIEELPFFTILGFLCGLGAATFIGMHRRLAMFLRYNRYAQKIFNQRKWLYASIVAILVGTLTYPLGFGQLIAGHLKFRDVLQDFFANCTWLQQGKRTVSCDRSLLDHWTGTSHNISIFLTLTCFFLTFYCLAILSSTVAVPSGIFMPVFVIGASLGRLTGECVSVWLDPLTDSQQVFPGIYAIVGAAAFAGAVTHTVSVIVIVFELTGQITYMLPVLLAVLMANGVCSYLEPSIYDSTIQMKRLPYLPGIPPARSVVHNIKAEDIMVKRIAYLTKQTTYRELRDMLAQTPHLKAYPLVNDNDGRILTGSVSRKALSVILRSAVCWLGLLGRKSHSTVSSNNTHQRHILNHSLSNLLLVDVAQSKLIPSHYSLERPAQSRVTVLPSPAAQSAKSSANNYWYKRSMSTSTKTSNQSYDAKGLILCNSMELDKAVDWPAEAIDQSPFQIIAGTSLFKIHSIFSLLGLNHAYVTDRGRLIGVIALRELRRVLESIYANPYANLRYRSANLLRRSLAAIPYRQTLPAIIVGEGAEQEGEEGKDNNNDRSIERNVVRDEREEGPSERRPSENSCSRARPKVSREFEVIRVDETESLVSAQSHFSSTTAHLDEVVKSAVV